MTAFDRADLFPPGSTVRVHVRPVDLAAVPMTPSLGEGIVDDFGRVAISWTRPPYSRWERPRFVAYAEVAGEHRYLAFRA